MRRVILLPSSAPNAFLEGQAGWAIYDEGATSSGVLRSFSEVQELLLSEEDECIVVVPGADAVLHEVEIPARTDAQARMAASFALEDDLAVDHEAIHYALSPRRNENWKRGVVTVSTQKMDSWLEGLNSIGITPHYLIPDFLLLPDEPGTLIAAERAGQIMLRRGNVLGLSIEVEMLPHISVDVLQGNDLNRVKLYAENAEERFPKHLWEPCRVEYFPAITSNEMAETAMHRFQIERGTNLLQGSYAPKRNYWVGATIWSRAAALAAAVVISYLGLLVAEGWSIASEAQRQQVRAEEMLLDAFPDINQVVNPRAQLRARVAELGSPDSSSFLELAAMLYHSTDRLSGVEIQLLQFDDLRGELSAAVAFYNYPDLEHLKSSIVELGGLVEEGASRQEGERIYGELRIVTR